MEELERITTAPAAKKYVASWLIAKNIKFDKLTARTVSFEDLARGSAIFVKIHGFVPTEPSSWNDIKNLVRGRGVCIE